MAEAGTEWAIGTEMNLVNRIIQQHPDKKNYFLKPIYVSMSYDESN